LDLLRCLDALVTTGYEEVCDAKVMVIVKKDVEVTIYPTGKLIIKTDSRAIAEKAMIEIYDKILPK
jgi:hypothetical protein